MSKIVLNLIGNSLLQNIATKQIKPYIEKNYMVNVREVNITNNKNNILYATNKLILHQNTIYINKISERVYTPLYLHDLNSNMRWYSNELLYPFCIKITDSSNINFSEYFEDDPQLNFIYSTSLKNIEKIDYLFK